VFVTLDALYVEGLVHITELGGEYFRFDEARQELRGERSGLRYVVGARVRVQVSRVDLDGRRIDFRMVHEGEGDKLITRGRSASPTRGADGSARGKLAEVEAEDRGHKRASKAAKAGKAKVGAPRNASGKAAGKVAARRAAGGDAVSPRSAAPASKGAKAKVRR
jgi:ribonuclease R